MLKPPPKESIVRRGLPVIGEHFPIDGETVLIETPYRKVLVPISFPLPTFDEAPKTTDYQTVEVELNLKVMVMGWSFACGYCKQTNELYFSFALL